MGGAILICSEGSKKKPYNFLFSSSREHESDSRVGKGRGTEEMGFAGRFLGNDFLSSMEKPILGQNPCLCGVYMFSLVGRFSLRTSVYFHVQNMCVSM